MRPACIADLRRRIGDGFPLGQATPLALAVGAVLFVISWHGLRRIDPSGSDERPPEDWRTAILVIVVIAAIMIGGLVWTPWLIIFAAIVFRLWVRLAYGSDGTTSR